MILVNKYEPEISLDHQFVECIKQTEELRNIFEFIDLPAHIREQEALNSSILRNYYANALDHNLVDIKTVKYILNKNLRPNGLSERAIDVFGRAEALLLERRNEEISLNLFYDIYRLLVLDLYQSNLEQNLFSGQPLRFPERLSAETELELDSLFEFLNHDSEFHPIMQSWILHFRLMALDIFDELKPKAACLLHYFWLSKHKMEIEGLLSLEHELYIFKNEYVQLVSPNSGVHLNDQLQFGLSMHLNQLGRIRDLLKAYFRKQVDFERLNPRQKNIMNYVFERGYKLKEIDESVLNKRQKLIMYIVQHRGFISTKDLVNEFDCNRKTIQRDFNLLLELGLVRSIGAGAGLKYCINLHERSNPELEQYQADFVQKMSGGSGEDYE
ncbi:MAG: DeoR family transcriptional regulator [Bacteroidia bacterium]|nr:DeoR family transcriptional regulator [Bacteroidia bacterium]